MMRDHVVGRTLPCGRVAYGNAQRADEISDIATGAKVHATSGSVIFHPRFTFERTARSVKAVMRSVCGKVATTALSLALALTCVPAASVAYAAEGNEAAGDSGSFELGSPIDTASDVAADAGVDADAGASRVSEEVPLERVIASGEATRSFFLATTLRDTAIPIVQATLTLAPAGSGGQSETTGDADTVGAGSAIPQVTGSFIHDGMTYAVTGEDEIALVAIDTTKLAEDAVANGTLVLPTRLSPSQGETYTLVSVMPRVFGNVQAARAEAGSNSASDNSADSADSESSPEAASGEGDDPDPDSDSASDLDPDATDDAAAGTAETADDAPALADEVSADDRTPSQQVTCLGIPATVTDIAPDAFEGYEPLEYLVVAEANSSYSSYDGVLYDAERTSLLLIPEGRQGAVRIAPTVTSVSAEMFSHRSGMALVADAGSTALTSEDGFLYNADLATFDFPVPIAITNDNSIVAATPGFEQYEGSLDNDAQERDRARAKALGMLEESETEMVFFDKAMIYNGWLGFALNSDVPFLLQFTWFVNGAWHSSETRGCGGTGPYRYEEGIISWINREDHHIQCMIVGDTEWRDLAPYANGYTFGGFYYDRALTSRVAVNASSSSITDIWLKFTPITYSITWNANGGSLSGQLTSYNITTNDYRLPTPTRAGYTFAGWDVTGASGVGIASNGTTSATVKKGTYGNLSAVAKWTRNNYSITYNDNGGTFSGKTGSYNIDSADFALPSTGTRTGYTFAGWNVTGASGAGITGNGTTNVTIRKGTYGNLTATAKWNTVSYSITYNDGGGSFSGKTGSYNVETADFKLPETGTRTGYTFAGWDVSGANGAGVTGNGGASVTIKRGTYGNLTATAKWTVNTYHLAWDVLHGTHSNRTTDFTVNDCPIEVEAAAPDAGYSFDGWSGTGVSGNPKQFEITAAFLAGKGDGETLSYAAAFTANPYTIMLHTNDGSGDDGSGVAISHGVTFDAPVAQVDIPKRYGYMFKGYFAKMEDGSKGECYFDANGSYARDAGIWKGLSDIDLFASWTLMGDLEVPINAPSSVSFVVDRATGDASAQDGSSILNGALRSAMPEEVPVASVEVETLVDDDGVTFAEKLLGEGNPEKCALDLVFAPGTAESRTASMSLAVPADVSDSANLWEFAPNDSPLIPAATQVLAGSSGDRIVEDDLGNTAEVGELALTYSLKTLPGFDVYKVPLADASKTVARVVFTVDLTGLTYDWF